jgi:non-lysosomal glucosylceramidase
VPHRSFRSFWASGTGWGEFSYAPGTSGGTFFTLRVLAGKLRCRSILITSGGKTARLRVGGTEYAHTASSRGNLMLLTAEQTVMIAEGEELRIEVGA